jgi:hypothetical protein
VKHEDEAEKALQDRLLAVRDDANNSCPGSREALRQFVGEHPERAAKLIDVYGNLASNAEKALIRSASGGNVLVEESARTWLADVKSTLTEPGDTALEEMLAHRVALCWLALSIAETLRAQRWVDDANVRSIDFWDRHTARLSTDFLRASRTLATVRKLRRPAMQVNVAEQQVNVTRP